MNGRILVIALAALGLSACNGASTSAGSGGSATGAVVGLKIPSNVSVVTAQGGSTAGGVMLTNGSGQSAMGLVTLSSFPATAQINTDPTSTYVWDDSMQSLSIVNQILCYISQTSADQMVNQGPYTALVNEKKCEQGQNQSSSASTGQSSATQAVQYNKWTVEATRKDNSSPEIVKAWVPGKPNATDPQDAQTILAEITVTAGKSAANPFGKFSMNFKGVADASVMGGPAGQEVTIMQGSLKTVDNSSNLPQFQFIDLEGQALDSSITSFSHKDAVNVILDDASGNTGRAKTDFSDTYDDGSGNMQTRKGAFVVDFNPSNFLRGKDANSDGTIDASEEVCTSRTNFNTQVWNYNLYFKNDGTFHGKAVTAGERVALNSGFPFVYTDPSSGKKLNGQVGYWGVWLENGATLPDGATISKVSYNDPSVSEAETVHVSQGSLVRRTAHAGSVTDFQGQQFQYSGTLPNSTSYGQYVVTIGDGTTLDDHGQVMPANDFIVTDSFTWGSNGMVKTDVPDVDITPTTSGDSLNLYSDALGGQVIFVYDSGVAPANRQITYYTQDTVYPGDTALFATGGTSATLYCYDQCLKGGLTATDVSNATSDQDLFYPPSSTPYQYTATVVGGNLVVKDQNGNVVSANGLDLSSLGHDWGIDTGEMVLDTTGITNPWDVYNQPVTYHWETGSNDYNHTVTVTDSGGNVVTFDQPLSFTYVHDAANDANNTDPSTNPYQGQTFVLQYGGPGQLWGFPSTQDAGGRWNPSISLADGTELTDAQGTVFVVKDMEREQQMKTAAVTSCTNGGLAVTGTLDTTNSPANDPTKMSLPTSADIGTVSFTLADKPTVSGAPAVIEGEVQ